MRRGVALSGLLVVLAVSTARAAGEDRLYIAIQKDPSFKVRMQAIRVLTKKLVDSKAEAPVAAIESLGRAAVEDDSYLVRGLACFSIGTLKDPRGRVQVERALLDAHPFVRAQAEHAMTLLPGPGMAVKSSTTTPVIASGDRRTLVVSVELTPGLEVPTPCVDKLKTALEDGFRTRAGPVFTVEGESAKSGYRLRGSIADRRIEPADDGSISVTIVVRVTIATWPENNLRHVISARASSKSKSNRAPALESLERKLIEAAAVQAVLDVMAEINRS